MSAPPTLELERALLSELAAARPSVERSRAWGRPVRLAGMDEVGRGSLAGPVAVGVAVLDARTDDAPAAVRDSKLLRPAARDALIPQIRSWALGSAVGMASPGEIDAVGIVGALRLAGRRAIAALGPEAAPDLVLLDGSHDWLSAPADLLALAAEPAEPAEPAAPGGPAAPAAPAAPAGQERPQDAPAWDGPVRTVVKGDMTCASIAAASVLAKVERDALMTQLDAEHPAYGWARNKGYGAAVHRSALLEHGATAQHRRSWNLGLPR